jgi:chemotaxis protein methyltransferase CheR
MEITDQNDNEKIEIDLLLQAIYLKYGYDFRNYAKASIRRRVRHRMVQTGLKTISEMQHRLIYERDFFDKLLLELTVNVTEMFRDPPFFMALREKILPELQKKTFVKVWHAGCATGEEVYSLAILMEETGMADHVRIYATDADETVLAAAKKGIYPNARMKEFTANYRSAGGARSFADYYTSRYEHAIMDQRLRKNIVFADHNLATDDVFGEMDLIFCRNVMIYFNRELQERVFRLFNDSLSSGGFLCLGSKETMQLSRYAEAFESLLEHHKIYRKK